MSICHYIYLAITKFNIKLRSYHGSPRHPSNEWKRPHESPWPNSSDSTQPHMDHSFCQPQPSDDYFSDPCYLLVILTLWNPSLFGCYQPTGLNLANLPILPIPSSHSILPSFLPFLNYLQNNHPPTPVLSP